MLAVCGAEQAAARTLSCALVQLTSASVLPALGEAQQEGNVLAFCGSEEPLAHEASFALVQLTSTIVLSASADAQQEGTMLAICGAEHATADEGKPISLLVLQLTSIFLLSASCDADAAELSFLQVQVTSATLRSAADATLRASIAWQQK